MAAKKAMKKFRKGEYIVYPTHGVGKVTSIESDTIAGFDLELYVISFEKEKMTLHLWVQKFFIQSILEALPIGGIAIGSTGQNS